MIGSSHSSVSLYSLVVFKYCIVSQVLFLHTFAFRFATLHIRWSHSIFSRCLCIKSIPITNFHLNGKQYIDLYLYAVLPCSMLFQPMNSPNNSGVYRLTFNKLLCCAVFSACQLTGLFFVQQHQ